MIKEIACFICTTPFQIISAILLVNHKKIDADLYIVPQFKNALELKEKIKEQGIFKNVVVVNTDEFEQYKKKKNKVFQYGGIVLNYMHVKKIVNEFLLKERNYNSAYISSKANVGRLIIFYFYKSNKLPTIHYIDDGESSYDNSKITEASRSDKLIRRIVFGKKVLEIAEQDRYLFSPHLFKLMNPNSKAVVYGMPDIEEFDKDILKAIFNITEDRRIKEFVVILDILRFENTGQEEGEKLLGIYKKVIEKFGSENVIIKKHPRDNSEEIPGWNYYTDYSVPMEALSIECNFGCKILISAGSTAVALPKILFDQEPIVILLNKLVTTRHSAISNSRDYYLMCKQLYTKTSRFITPRTEDELNEVLDSIKKTFECNIQ